MENEAMIETFEDVDNEVLKRNIFFGEICWCNINKIKLNIDAFGKEQMVHHPAAHVKCSFLWIYILRLEKVQTGAAVI